MHTVAKVNRAARKYIVEISVKARLTTTKVVPQTNATITSAASAFQRVRDVSAGDGAIVLLTIRSTMREDVARFDRPA